MDSSSPRRQSTTASQHPSPRPSDSPRTTTTRGLAASGATRAASSDPSPSLGTSWATEDSLPSAKESTRASIGHALRVQIPSIAPPVVQRMSTHQASLPTTPKSASHPPQSRTAAPTASPRVPQSSNSSNSATSTSNSRSVADSLGSFSFPPTPPSLRATSPPRGIASPRLNSITPSSANSPRAYPQPTAGEEGDLFAASGSSAGGGGASGSLRKKPPPPLALRMDDQRTQKGKGMARGDSSDSSELDEDWQEEGYRVQQEPARRYGSRDVGEGSSRGGSQGYTAPLPPHGQVQRSDSKDEARDTLSSLFKFPSPQLGTSIPSSHLDFSTIDSHIEDLEADDEAGEDDTATTNLSFLSSSSDGTREYTGEVPRPQGSSSTSYSAPRQYTGLGLGLPFSMSAAANLSSLSPTLSPPSSSSIQQRTTSDDQGGFPRSPSGGERSRSTSGTSGPESPVTDRSKLIGLGELATPRWTSGVLERRWGTPYDEKRKASRDEDGLDASEQGHDPMPPIARKLSADSPSATRQPATRPAPRPVSSYEDSSSSRSASYAMHPSALFPSTASSQSKATPPKPTSLDDFTNEPTPFAQPNFSRQHQQQHPPQSPVYSLEAVSIPDDLSGLAEPPQETLRHSQLVEETPSAQQFESMALQKRRSMVGTSSAPNSAAGGSWTTTAPAPNVVGLGFDYDSQGAEAKGGDASAQAQRRASSGSMQATTHARRSSSGRAYSVDAGATAKLPTKTMAHRRQSASKSGFAHLPPSPAAPVATQALANTGVPIIPFTLPTTTTTAASTSTTAAQPPHTPGRTPDMARLSHHSHHSSPSIIAASILRQTRDPEGRDIDMDVAAAADEGTAEALRKLDGLSSPRLSKVFSSGPASTGSRSRTTSRSGDATTPPALLRRDSEEVKARRRTRSSTGASVSALAKDVEQAMMESTSAKPTPRPTSSHTHAPGGSPAPAQSPAFALASGSQMPRSPLVPSSEPHSSSTARASSRPGSSGNGNEVPFPSVSPFKRGSSSSASLAAGTSTSASGSHDSTSGTSISGSFVATTAAKSSSLKNRRGSVGSDVSSIMGSGEGAASKSERSFATSLPCRPSRRIGRPIALRPPAPQLPAHKTPLASTPTIVALPSRAATPRAPSSALAPPTWSRR
ncbi:hypothetical protein BCR35DRAFT_97550 [Leucosporidium creatinivorum]|uniref:Uncharacterized protein n=1 Tax=Leucosporidium creatinivorum TaxID=106004 RepID=A0A1Y2F614_9BASI|nr:hypothetical protein BCR35DRAFT_97550 [Leucosporidium creatinivorum]